MYLRTPTKADLKIASAKLRAGKRDSGTDSGDDNTGDTAVRQYTFNAAVTIRCGLHIPVTGRCKYGPYRLM